VGYELGTRADVLTMEWPLSSDVEHREAPQSFGLVDTSVAHMSAEDARDALMAIPNDELLSACDDRDTWFRILCAAKAAGVSLEDAMHWCALHPSHNEAHFKKTWVSIRSGREGATPAAYLFAVANQYGFDRHIVANFETLDTVEDALEVFGNAPAGQKIQSKKFKLTPVPLLPNAAYVRDKDGFRIATAPNLRKAVGNNSTVQADLAYDVFTDELIIAPFSTNAAGEDICTGDWRPLRDEDLTEFRIQLELQGFKPVPKELMGDIVKLVCWQKQIDTAQIWLDGLSWDGIPRIDRFMADYMRTSDTAYATALSQYLWTAMAARIASPGCQADIVPVLVGAQGAGKSRALQAMAPHLDHYAEISLAERDDNLSRMLRGCLVAEIPELKGLHSRESEAIKAFLTKTHERWTPKYREFTTTFPRRCIFFGTTNEREFLSDITGNRRWAPIEVATRGAIERELIREDRDQLWAEAYARFQAGGIEWVDVERLAQVEHEAYMMTDEWEGFVSDWLTIPDPLTGIAPGSDPEGFTGADVLTQAIRVQTHQINRASEMRIARVLSGLGFKKKQVQKGGERRYRYYKK
jgi:predicted P-loop ATPase